MKVINPVLKMDMPDMDVIKANGYYYMVSTTMFFMPGGPILRSKDLKNWEIVSYIFDTIADNDIHNLKNGKNAYGAGQWATSLAYHNGIFYAAFVCNDLKKTFIYSTDDIEKSFWKQHELDGIFHDMSFLFWDNRVFLVYGNGDIFIAELNADLTGLKEDGLKKLLFSTPGKDDGIMLRCEGCRAYVRSGYIYLCFIEWPSEGNGNFRRREICYRSKTLESPFERQIIFDDDMGDNNRGIAQGVLIEGYDNKWYSMLFQDHGAVGRIPYLIPMTWENDWPVIGVDGKTPEELDIPMNEVPTAPLVTSDSFNHFSDKMLLQFQWNHNPIKEGWSFTERPGYLRLKNMQLATSIMDARNTLTERTVTPKSVYTIEGDFSGLKDGDYAGLTAFMGRFGTIGVSKENGEFFITLKRFDGVEKKIVASELQGFNAENVWFRIVFDFENDDKAYFYYSVDGSEFIQLGDALEMAFTLDVFVGYRIGVFSYGTKELGGMADFRNLIFTT
ncbi:glycoside hydrolase family 43 protein [Pseudobutyrivibrio xylanivorans]|uniref:Beta-xylosidase n=1 Tax=Pseudobutyrivibrio xylanivorans TaxID=185007 RepID=A0A1G5RVE4_PSEXY|nr:glycoside hydrolase 43 family protein [Pseudobutyrivibrio xylanivorans]SCZ77299.1 Beta-xylosidase [Pseudobutyrivibrio xylanivorans]